jgi:predicted porin
MRTRTVLAALAFGPALAFAQTSVGIHGLVDAYAGSSRSNGQGGSGVIESGGMSPSFLGISGSEGLGHDVNAVFALEGYFRDTTGQQGRTDKDPLFSKNAYVGLAGSFGSLTLGRQTALLYTNGSLFNPFGNSTVFSPALLQLYQSLGAVYPTAPLAGDISWSNAARYSAPAYRGLHADLMVQVPDRSSGASDDNRNRGLAATMRYQFRRMDTTVGYQHVNLEADADGHKQEAGNVGVAYDFGRVKPFVQFYRIWDRFNAGAGNDRHDIWVVGASVPLRAGSVLAGYGRTTTRYDLPGQGDARRTTWSLGYDLPLSRRTDVYAVARRDVAKRDLLRANDEVAAVGIRLQF